MQDIKGKFFSNSSLFFITINIGMQKLPVYLYSNLFSIQLDLDNEVRETNNTMYQRELRIQKGLKNKVQLQFKNSDQKAVRVRAVTNTASPTSTSSNTISLVDASNVQVGMIINSNNIQTGTYVSAISANVVTVENLNPVYDPDTDQFLSPIFAAISSGTSISFNQNFVFSMFDSEQQRMVLQKSVEVLDDGSTTATRGLALLTLTENDTRNLDTSYYTFGVTLTDNDGANLPAYSNTYYGINGTVRLTHDLWPTLKDSGIVHVFQKYVNVANTRYEFYTGNLRAYPELTQTTTMAMYLDNFTGTVKIQASMENGPGTFANYVTLETKTYTGFNGVDYANAEGNWSDVRIIWIPDNWDIPDGQNYYSPQMPGNPTPGSDYWPNGKIDKILYRS